MLLAALSTAITAAPNPAVGYLIDNVGKGKTIEPHTAAPPPPTVTDSSYWCAVKPVPGVDPKVLPNKLVPCDSLSATPAASPAPTVSSLPSPPPNPSGIANVHVY